MNEHSEKRVDESGGTRFSTSTVSRRNRKRNCLDQLRQQNEGYVTKSRLRHTQPSHHQLNDGNGSVRQWNSTTSSRRCGAMIKRYGKKTVRPPGFRRSLTKSMQSESDGDGLLGFFFLCERLFSPKNKYERYLCQCHKCFFQLQYFTITPRPAMEVFFTTRGVFLTASQCVNGNSVFPMRASNFFDEL